MTVQEGCDKFCSFCVVPYTRGVEASRPAAKSLSVTQPVRSGTQIYARGTDLVVTAPVSAGAEIMADGPPAQPVAAQ